MNKENLIQLTQNLYRLTLFFPKKEPLRYKMRELASDILARFFINNSSESKESGSLSSNMGALVKRQNECEAFVATTRIGLLEVLAGFFEVAKTQNWVSQADILATQKEYDKLREELTFKGQAIIENSQTNQMENHKEKQVFYEANRQEKILEFLKKQGKAQVWQVQQIFPSLTKRTLRRDFEQMLNQDLIERIGEKNNTFYRFRQQVNY